MSELWFGNKKFASVVAVLKSELVANLWEYFVYFYDLLKHLSNKL